MRTYVLHSLSCVIALMALGFINAAHAVSPFETPYGIQWTYLNGGVNDERNGWLEASPDGSAWFVVGYSSYTGTYMDGGGNELPRLSLFGDQGNGGSWDSGYGQISPQGAILQGKSLPNIGSSTPPFDTIQPGLTGPYTGENQSYTRQSLSMQGSSAMLAWDGRSDAFWDGEPLGGTSDKGGEFMTVKFDPDGSGPLTEGTSSFKTTTNFQPFANIRTQAAAASQNDNTTWFVGGYQSGEDVINIGDATNALTSSYSPYIAKKDGSNILTGPALQGNSDGRSYFFDIDVNEGTNKVFAVGGSWVGSGGTPTFWDADGDGTPEETVPVTKTDPDMGLIGIYNATTLALENTASWNSDYGDDWIFSVAATPDGGLVTTGRTKGSFTGFTNPSSGVNDDIYVAKYDAAGALQWDWQSETPEEDEGVSVSVDDEGNVYVGSRFDVVRTNPANNTNAAVGSGSHQVTKFDSAGNLVWNNLIDGGGTLDDIFSASATSKNKVYVAAEHNPVLGPAWANTVNGYTFDANTNDDRELLIQKLVPGDFTEDGFVDEDDIAFVESALAGGSLIGDETYDFDEDGDSTLADIDYWKDNILDLIAAGNPDGDYNDDGTVDLADYTIWRNNLGAVAGTLPNDPNSSVIGEDQYNTWRANYGATASLEGGSAAVPEPSTFVLMAGIAGLGLWRLRRRAA